MKAVDLPNLSQLLHLSGRLSIIVENLKTGEVQQIQKKNLVILEGRNYVRDMLSGDNLSGLTHMALGTDDTEPTIEPTITEVYRKQLTSTTKSDGKLNVDLYLSSQDANGYTISSAALFGGGATDALGTGRQYNKVIFEGIPKNKNLSVTFTWDLFFNAG